MSFSLDPFDLISNSKEIGTSHFRIESVTDKAYTSDALSTAEPKRVIEIADKLDILKWADIKIYWTTKPNFVAYCGLEALKRQSKV